MTTAQTVVAVGALVSAVLAVVAGIDPGGILSRPDIQTEVVGVFTAAVPLGLGLWAYFHHDLSKAAPAAPGGKPNAGQ